MKTSLVSAVFGLLAGTVFAGFENWTSSDGKTAELELVSVVEKDGEKVGEFRTRNGNSVTIKASGLSPEDSERLANWTGSASAAGPASVFDSVLKGNLVILKDRKFQSYELPAKPKKYYVFYYTASWCPPCQAYTPDLVRFYNRTKRDNDNFELVLISSDRKENAMEEYAKDKKMPWPQLKFSATRSFGGKFNHGVRGIPAVIVCDLEGKVVARTRDLSELRKLLQ